MPTCWSREYAKKLRGRWQEICLICQQIGEDTQSAQTDSQPWLSVKPKLDEMQMDLRDKEQSRWIAGDPTSSGPDQVHVQTEDVGPVWPCHAMPAYY